MEVLPGVELFLLGFDVILARVPVVDQLPGDLVDHGDARGLVVRLRLEALKPEAQNGGFLFKK